MMDADYLEEYPNEQASRVDKSVIDKYMDEYYQLDFEDIVGDQPVRFKYRKVDPNFYSLKPEEILEAEDADLNEVIGLKKLGPYRQGETKDKDEKRWKKMKKKKLWEFRAKLKGKQGEQAEAEEEPKKRKRDSKVDEKRLETYSASSSKKKKNKK
jgi:protein KRI1